MKLWDPDTLIRAWKFAATHHHGQGVPGTEDWGESPGKIPYLYHLGLVSAEVMRAVSVEEVQDPDLAVICAILHDTIEDAAADYDMVKEAFGAGVADGVLALSKQGDMPKHERLGDSVTRIKAQPREVWMVKLADRITNLQPPPKHWSREKCLKYAEDAQLILDELGAASDYLAARLAAKITAYQVPK